MIAAQSDGEDSAGRSKLRLQTPQELVERACNVAGLMYEEIKARGWVTDVPDPEIESDKDIEKALV